MLSGLTWPTTELVQVTTKTFLVIQRIYQGWRFSYLSNQYILAHFPEVSRKIYQTVDYDQYNCLVQTLLVHSFHNTSESFSRASVISANFCFYRQGRLVVLSRPPQDFILYFQIALVLSHGRSRYRCSCCRTASNRNRSSRGSSVVFGRGMVHWWGLLLLRLG